MIESSFPESNLKSKFGILGVTLSKEEFEERTQRLDQWLSEVLTCSLCVHNVIFTYIFHVIVGFKTRVPEHRQQRDTNQFSQSEQHSTYVFCFCLCGYFFFQTLMQCIEGELDKLVVTRPSDASKAGASNSTGPSPVIIKLLMQGHPLIQHKVRWCGLLLNLKLYAFNDCLFSLEQN